MWPVETNVVVRQRRTASAARISPSNERGTRDRTGGTGGAESAWGSSGENSVYPNTPILSVISHIDSGGFFKNGS